MARIKIVDGCEMPENDETVYVWDDKGRCQMAQYSDGVDIDGNPCPEFFTYDGDTGVWADLDPVEWERIEDEADGEDIPDGPFYIPSESEDVDDGPFADDDDEGSVLSDMAVSDEIYWGMR